MKSNELEYCKIIGVQADGCELVSYRGSFCSKNHFVKEFKDGKITYTYDECEARKFTDDVEGTECMRELIRDGMTHVLVWSYRSGKLMAEVIHYPNEYWDCNSHLQPLLMTHTVSEYHQNPY